MLVLWSYHPALALKLIAKHPDPGLLVCCASDSVCLAQTDALFELSWWAPCVIASILLLLQFIDYVF